MKALPVAMCRANTHMHVSHCHIVKQCMQKHVGGESGVGVREEGPGWRRGRGEEMGAG